MQKPKTLILCTGNSCRSHMAEGILRAAANDLFEVYSAGSKPAGYVHPTAIEVMSEIGIDLSAHTSKSLEQYLDAGIHTIVTVCGNANEACPVFPGMVNRYHWGFEDPAHATGSEEEILEEFRNIRDQIKLVFEAYVSGYRQAESASA
ncbi:MAG: arsenate reductase ArsC [Opitutales bacterium]|jgi:arsenate reductase (thioredoxin)|nr:arsenate reductase ArsC [Opitutales bacterium]